MRKSIALILAMVTIFSLMACSSAPVETMETEDFQLTKTTEDNAEQTTTEEQKITEPKTEIKEEVSEDLPEVPNLPEKKEDPEISPEKLKEPEITAWKEAYLNILETYKDYHTTYALVYIDNDDIPELYMHGDCEATGDGVYSYKKGALVEQRLNRTWGGRYIEKNGEIFNFNGNMGLYYTQVYKLTDEGFTQTFYALETENVEQWVGDEPVISYEYFVEKVAVSETEYRDAKKAAFNYEASKIFHQNAVTYDEIKEQIKGC